MERASNTPRHPRASFRDQGEGQKSTKSTLQTSPHLPLNQAFEGRGETLRPSKDEPKGQQSTHIVLKAWDTPQHPMASFIDRLGEGFVAATSTANTPQSQQKGHIEQNLSQWQLITGNISKFHGSGIHRCIWSEHRGREEGWVMKDVTPRATTPTPSAPYAGEKFTAPRPTSIFSYIHTRLNSNELR